MLACVAGSMLWVKNWQVQGFCNLDSHRIALNTSELEDWKTFSSFKIQIYDFHENNNLFHLTLQVANIGIGVIIIGVTLQWKCKVLLPCENVTELCNSPSKNIPFFLNADSWFLMNTVIHSILPLFTSCKHRHQYYIHVGITSWCPISLK